MYCVCGYVDKYYMCINCKCIIDPTPANSMCVYVCVRACMCCVYGRTKKRKMTL